MKKLVLFDIDGTLIYHSGNISIINNQFRYGIKKIFNQDYNFNIESQSDHGKIEKSILKKIAYKLGIPTNEFEKNFFQFAQHSVDYLENISKTQVSYVSIKGVQKCLLKLSTDENIYLGLLTGRMEKTAWWVLRYCKLNQFFKFGLFGDEADNRNNLAKLVITKARNFFKIDFDPDEIVIIGDTIGDYRAAKAIGAKSILVLTGGHDKTQFKNIQPDLIINNLLDPRLYKLIKQ